MKILLISDLHFKEKTNWNDVNRLTENMIQCVNRKMKTDDKILVITLGDIIDGGKSNAFQEARVFYSKLQQNLAESEFRFIPGNHELIGEDLSEFNSFIKEFSNQNSFTDKDTVQIEDIQGFRILFVDSTLTRKYDNPGQICIKEIETKMSDSKNIICMHFPPCVQDGIDKNIPNTKELIATRTNYIFYGHQHGDVRLPDFLDKDTDIHSLGTLLKDDVNEHEFILMEINGGKIRFAYRYIHNGKKFTPEILLPQKENLSSDRIKAPTPADYPLISCLNRKVKTVFEDFNSSKSDDIFWSKYFGEDIDKCIKENNLIILLGDAGSGKSFELKRIYSSYIDDEEYYPIWVQLKNVNYKKLSEYIEYCNITIDRKTPLLIFDGLDEMQSQNVNNFIRDIGSVVVGDSEIKVIISVRTALSRPIDGFIQCTIIDIDDNGIKEYAKSKDVDPEMFYKSVCDTGCLGLARRPFYLVEMVKLFVNTNTLPKEIDLLSQMIKNRFYDSDKKHAQALLQGESLIENEALLERTLSEISFFMQVYKEYNLSNLNYTDIWDLNVRNLLSRTGLLTKTTVENVVVWEFEHNNFREYLAAKYLNKLSFDEIIRIIVYDENRSKLRPSWFNVVAYLLSMQNDDKLINWLTDNAKDALCNFESDKLTLSNRDELFLTVLNDLISKQLPIFSLYDVNKVGRYFQSNETISFMIKILKTNTNNYAISNVLHVLRCCDNYFGKENELRITIIERSLRDTDYEHIVELSIEVLKRIFADDLPDITSEIFMVLIEDRRSRVFGALCELLVEAEVVDDYIDDIINALNSINDIVGDYSAHQAIENVLTNVNSFASISSVIKFFCNKDLPYELNSKNGIFASICEKASELFHRGKTEILSTMIDCFITMASRCDRRKCQILKTFFQDTKSLIIAFEDILNRNMSTTNMMFTIEDIMDETIEDTLIAKYLHSDMIDEAFKWYASRLPYNSVIFMKLDDAVLKKEKMRIQREPQIDWDKNRKAYNQAYFNCLFDKGLFSKLIDELLAYINNNDITCGQLVSVNSSEIYDFSAVPSEREDLQNVRTALYHCGFSTNKVTRFFKYINWEEFCTREICRILQYNEKDIEPNVAQKQYIDDYLKVKMEGINFEDYSEYVIDNDENKCEFIRHIMALAIRSRFSFTDEKLLEMLMLPWYIFASSTSSSESKTLNFIEERISDADRLKTQILINIQTKDLDIMAMHTHIIYCHKNGLNYAIDIAKELCISKSERAKWRKNTAADYLIAQRGVACIEKYIIPFADEELLGYLASKADINSDKLAAKLIEENEKSEDKTLFLCELIKMNSRYGLKIYYDLAVKSKRLPDDQNNSSSVHRITEAIRNVNSVSVLPEIKKLVLLCFCGSFNDIGNFGLQSSLGSAINNIMQIDKEATKEFLDNLILENSLNDKMSSFCNWYLKDVEKAIFLDRDTPWNLCEVKRFLVENRNGN